ncbi:lysylphosphatidylglycerol synthase transmembrane domain-containing protein [Actinoplanes couchii]|uniref:Integral membrane protein-like protein n=1 Tax=Actinoplanes couchii TaxID=403638 RepID=A0ABQ3X7A6_9ACTN|nr:YbhN family protein [Actinoplanes couchii]MDR6322197.1 uncharacterized membrane protein YbhN (UPF0104 family) [Actinoplanes couchii]GID54362.1 hypothetical protein Aco03nite_027660 [Actinoplanes couchii]
MTTTAVKGGRATLRAVLVLLLLVVAAIAVRDRLPDLGETVVVLGEVDGWWATAAVIAALASQLAFAEQQRQLLAGAGVAVPVKRVLAMTLGRSAMSMTLPAGSAVSAAFAYRVYRHHGAATSVAVRVTAVSGVLSLAGLGLLYLAGWLLSTPAAWSWAALGAATLGLLAILFWDKSVMARHAIGRAEGRALAAAVINWALDMFCLVAAAAACGVTLGWWQLALVYLAVQVVRQIPLTPGGLGLIEASMLTGLVTAGMPESTAAAVVLLYRLVSFWMILPLGLTGWMATRRT